MKKRILSLLLAVCCLAGIAEARTFVLSIGISNYANPSVNNLPMSSKGALRFRDAMLQQTKDVTTLTSANATTANIMQKLSAICNRAQKEDRIVMYFNGHGDTGGLLTFDGFLKYKEIADQLDKSKANLKFVVIEACHSGSAKDAGISNRNNQVWMVASRADEYSWQGAVADNSYFTLAVLKGLRGKADFNADKQVTVLELFKYAYNDVVNRNGKNVKPDEAQHPQLIAPKTQHNRVLMKYK